MDIQERCGVSPHLMIDCYGCSKEKLADRDFIFEVLASFPEKIKLNKIKPPQVFNYQGEASENSGVSGVVQVAESHISIHTFPDQQHVFIDVFSSKEFDSNFARQELLRLFEANRDEIRVIDSGAGLSRHSAIYH